MTDKNYPSYLDNPKPTRKQTNYDRIRNMSVEEMAKFLLKVHCDGFMCGAWDDNDTFPFNKEWLETEESDE